MKIKALSMQQANENYKSIKSQFKKVKVKSISYSNAYIGSQLYVLIGENNKILYVGETGTSLYNRIRGDGSGSHYNKAWFKYVRIVSFMKLPNNKFIRRKWGNELSIVLKPVYN